MILVNYRFWLIFWGNCQFDSVLILIFLPETDWFEYACISVHLPEHPRASVGGRGSFSGRQGLLSRCANNLCHALDVSQRRYPVVEGATKVRVAATVWAGEQWSERRERHVVRRNEVVRCYVENVKRLVTYISEYSIRGNAIMMWLQWKSNKKLYVACRMAALTMPLNDLEGHLLFETFLTPIPH